MSRKVLLSESKRQSYDVFHAGELGECLMSKFHVVKGKYSFAVDGGAVGTINLKDEFGEEIVIPSGAIVYGGLVDIVTAFVSTGGAGTVSLGVNTTVDLLAAVDADTLSGLAAIIPVMTAATAVKLTAERKLQLAIAGQAMTAGVANVYVCLLYMD